MSSGGAEHAYAHPHSNPDSHTLTRTRSHYLPPPLPFPFSLSFLPLPFSPLFSLSVGEHALQVLPALVDGIPEARLNLVVYHLRHDAVNEAYELVRDLEPTTPQVSVVY